MQKPTRIHTGQGKTQNGVINKPLDTNPTGKIPKNALHTTSTRYIFETTAKNRQDLSESDRNNDYLPIIWDLYLKTGKPETILRPFNNLTRIRKWRGSKGLEFNLTKEIGFDGKIWEKLKLANFRELKSLMLYLNDSEIKDIDLKALASSVRRNPVAVKRIYLDIHQYNHFSQRAFNLLLLGISRYLEKLEDLRLDFGDQFNISKTNLKSVLPGLMRNFRCRRNLKIRINFSNPSQVDDHLLSDMGKGISRYLENLTTFQLFLKINTIRHERHATKEGVLALISGISKLIGLKKLVLSLDIIDHFDDKSLALLGNKITKNLVNLTHLSLQFCGWDKITGVGVKKFATQIFKDLIHLKDLQLNFDHCAMVYPQDVKSLDKMIAKHLIQTQENHKKE